MNLHDADRRLRAEYPNAIYHVMSRGVQRSDIFLNDDDRSAFFRRCEATVDRFGWLVYAAVQMTNHFHLLFKTPQPNLCSGAQNLLGPYARSFNRRHERSGHVFEARYRCRIIEDESYLWTVSRYDHLNPVPSLASHPALWKWSSYPGYHNPSLRLPWIQYDELLSSWTGAFGGSERSYCEYVENQLETGDRDYPDVIDGWIIGSNSFANRIRKMVSPESETPIACRARQRPVYDLDDVIREVVREFSIDPSVLSRKSSRHPARHMLAYFARHYSTATLQEIANSLGLAKGDSVHKSIKKLENSPSTDLRDHMLRLKAKFEGLE